MRVATERHRERSLPGVRPAILIHHNRRQKIVIGVYNFHILLVKDYNHQNASKETTKDWETVGISRSRQAFADTNKQHHRSERFVYTFLMNIIEF